MSLAEETNNMDRQVKEKWIEALRSGEFKQTSGALAVRNGNDSSDVSYCCLGVLCEIAVAEDVILPRVFSEYEVAKYDDTSTAFLPETVANWSKAFNTSVVMSMNDEGSSFNEIADYIEENY